MLINRRMYLLSSLDTLVYLEFCRYIFVLYFSTKSISGDENYYSFEFVLVTKRVF